MRIATIVLVVGILISWSVEISAADIMRCGNDFVKINDSAFVVVKKCGEPVSKIHMGYTINRKNQRELVIEEWIYGPRGGGYYYFIIMTGGHVSEIRSERP
jgi:hypothetical protein